MGDISYSVDGAVATVKFSRPEVLNAFTDAMETELMSAFDAADADPAVRVVVLTGEGRGFCAGMDLSDAGRAFEAWRRSETAPDGTQVDVEGESLPLRRDGGGRVVLRIFAMEKPVIAAINGPAAGIGATITLPCDFRLASSEARFGFVFNRRGFVPEACSTWFLPRVVAMQTALEWVYTGRVFDAVEALEAGLVRSVHDPSDLLPAAYALAHDIATNTSAVSTALARQMMWRMQGASHPLFAHEAETISLNILGVGADGREGGAAFLEKRAPRFTDIAPDDVPYVLQGLPAPEVDMERLARNYRIATATRLNDSAKDLV